MMSNVEAFSTCVTLDGDLLRPVDGAILEMRNTLGETGHLFRMWPCSAPGGELESGRKFCQAVSKFCSLQANGISC